jgi:hypothetical protein
MFSLFVKQNPLKKNHIKSPKFALGFDGGARKLLEVPVSSQKYH